MSVGERLREERERLGLSQAGFANKVGVHRNTQVRYERNKTHPDADYLAVIRSLGVDDTYVLTGTRRSDREAIARDEAEGVRHLILAAIADHFGIDADEIAALVKWLELLQSNELTRRQFNISEEAKRLTWRLLIDHGILGTWIEISDGRMADADLLCHLIQEFEMACQRARDMAAAPTIPAKARAIATLFFDAKKAGYFDSKMVEAALKVAQTQPGLAGGTNEPADD